MHACAIWRKVEGASNEVLGEIELVGATKVDYRSRWEKSGRGGTEDETVKLLDGIQRV
jgi:hypothetical protein